jgi:ABC-type transport system involved in multi-copper enzyme maturation permease subunit
MDTPTTPATVKYSRLLPYWAVFQADCKQTLCSWIYRVWVLLTMGAAVGYLLYRFGAKEVSAMVQPAPEALAEFFKWVVFGSVTLVIVLTAGSICSERGSMADSVLSRGISRYQYFLGKWHARLLVVLVTFFVMSGVALGGAYFLLHSDNLALSGSLVALLTVASLLASVITCGVSVSAMSNNTVVSIAVVWLALYGGCFLLSLLPGSLPTPDRALHRLPEILKGFYDWPTLSRLMLGSLVLSLVSATVGMVFFSRRDV